MKSILTKERLFYVWDCMTTKKKIIILEKSEFNKIMSIFDLTFLGVGSMLGMGVYVMQGNLARTVGPAVLLSFFVAGIAATLSALCYAEFAGRAPGTGSAYAYCYISVGEFLAFILGWNLALEFVIGTACLARGLSGYLDSIFSQKYSHFMSSSMPMGLSFLSDYPDFIAFLIMFIFSCLLSVGVKASTTVNNVLVVINMVTISILVVIGIMNSDVANWKLSPQPSQKMGSGGFLPFGFSSIIEGAATCFYAYTGFDTVATAGGEAKRPQRAIPIALLLSLSIAMLVYCTVSATFTLMWPYWDQRVDAPYPYILTNLGLTWAKWIVTVGAISAILGCILGSIFGMARVIYTIASDGLLYASLGKVNRVTKTPLAATMVSGTLTGIIAIVLDVDQLMSMTSIGTLMAYTMVGICVLLLRYDDPEKEVQGGETEIHTGRGFFGMLFNVPRRTIPDEETGYVARWATYILCLLAFLLCGVLAFRIDSLFSLEPFTVIAALVFLALYIFAAFVISRQPGSSKEMKFKVKPVPLLPVLSIFINVYLMLKLDVNTWIRFVVWFVIGMCIYFGYGIWNSKERTPIIETEKPKL